MEKQRSIPMILTTPTLEKLLDSDEELRLIIEQRPALRDALFDAAMKIDWWEYATFTPPDAQSRDFANMVDRIFRAGKILYEAGETLTKLLDLKVTGDEATPGRSTRPI